MRLRELTVENFRSITKAYKLPLSNSTVLIGPNNEGKSNVLRALVLATQLLIGRRRDSFRLLRYEREAPYDWDRDFPLHLQEKRPEGKSVFVLEYELSDGEVDEFQEKIKSKLNGTLPVRIAIGKAGAPDITIHKKGPGGPALSAKHRKVAEFLADRVDLEYIPAVRTAASAHQVVDALVARELRTLETTTEYQDAVHRVSELQRPLLEELSESIQSTLVKFLPAVVSVEVRTHAERRYEALRRCEILIDDGSKTELRYKGDGVQSLAALGLMRHASDKESLGKNVVVAIEEPESHLHPRAIHELRSVIDQIAAKHQTVLTTHCPLFVSRENVAANIIVNNRRAKPAESIAEVRRVLGVRAADNLLHAELVLVVEGEDDRISISAILTAHSSKLAAAMRHRRLAVDSLAGASNLSYKLGMFRDAVCASYCLLDADHSGRTAADRAIQDGLLSIADLTLTECPGLSEAEFEDLLDPDVVQEVLKARYGIVHQTVRAADRKRKWSERMASLFRACGKTWTDKTCAELKLHVAKEVERRASTAIHASRRSILDSLVTALESRLGDE